MARMSIDDKVCRDPRITVLAALLKWSRRETVGCLILEVWPICYDQETAVVSEKIIDAAADCVGFAQAMVDAELATRDRSGKIRINGAKERIKYLDHKKRAGREGGLKSAEVRNKTPKQTSSTGGSTPQAAGNPSVPDPVPDLSPAPDHSEGATAGAAPPAPPGLLGEVKRQTDRAARIKAAAIPDRAWKAADYLRQLVLTEDPNALVSKQPWGAEVQTGWRLGWANEIRLMVERDKRSYEHIAETLRYVFTEQKGDAKFIVQSADALRDKWDRIQAVRRNAKPTGPQPRQIPLAPSALRGKEAS